MALPISGWDRRGGSRRPSTTSPGAWTRSRVMVRCFDGQIVGHRDTARQARRRRRSHRSRDNPAPAGSAADPAPGRARWWCPTRSARPTADVQVQIVAQHVRRAVARAWDRPGPWPPPGVAGPRCGRWASCCRHQWGPSGCDGAWAGARATMTKARIRADRQVRDHGRLLE